MKKYDVSIRDNNGDIFLKESIEADSPDSAYKSFVEFKKDLPYNRVLVNWGWGGAKPFDPPHYEGHVDPRKITEKEKEEAEKRRLDAEKQELLDHLAYINSLSEKIKSNGFQNLSSKEISVVAQIVDETTLSSEIREEKLNLLLATLSDEQAYRFFTLRSSSRTSLQQQAMLEAMNVNLSDISKKTGGVKMASMFTGMAAARHLGEEIAEDMGGGDDDGGGWDE